MAFLDFVAEKESHNQHEKFYGNYRGIVVDNNDPLTNGRCKINVFGVYDELKSGELPWATFADPFMGGLQGYGSSLIPEVDTHVWVFFEGGDVRHPVYFAGAPAMNGEGNPDLPEESSDDYPNKIVLKFKEDIVLTIDKSTSTVSIEADKIDLGREDSLEQSVLGKKLEEWVNNELTPWLNTQLIVTGNLGAPTSPVITPFEPGTAAPGGDVYSKNNRNQ